MSAPSHASNATSSALSAMDLHPLNVLNVMYLTDIPWLTLIHASTLYAQMAHIMIQPPLTAKPVMTHERHALVQTQMSASHALKLRFYQLLTPVRPVMRSTMV